MGASEQHAVMAAGLAGGIGLSGSGCGALGAAIWLLGLNLREAGRSNKVIDARIGELVERFLASSGQEYACAAIVGRRCENADDHAGHLARGGCAELVEAITAAAEKLRELTPSPVGEEIVRPDGEVAAA